MAPGSAQLLHCWRGAAAAEATVLLALVLHADGLDGSLSCLVEVLLHRLNSAVGSCAGAVAVLLTRSLDLERGPHRPQDAPGDADVRHLSSTIRDLLHSCHSGASLVLAGFAEGATWATRALVELRGQAVEGCALLLVSGALETELLRSTAFSLAGASALNIFAAHGEDDDVIPEAVVYRAIAKLREARDSGAPLSLETYFHEGGHEVGEGTPEAAGTWLARVAPTLPVALRSPGALTPSTCSRTSSASPVPTDGRPSCELDAKQEPGCQAAGNGLNVSHESLMALLKTGTAAEAASMFEKLSQSRSTAAAPEEQQQQQQQQHAQQQHQEHTTQADATAGSRGDESDSEDDFDWMPGSGFRQQEKQGSPTPSRVAPPAAVASSPGDPAAPGASVGTDGQAAPERSRGLPASKEELLTLLQKGTVQDAAARLQELTTEARGISGPPVPGSEKAAASIPAGRMAASAQDAAPPPARRRPGFGAFMAQRGGHAGAAPAPDRPAAAAAAAAAPRRMDHCAARACAHGDVVRLRGLQSAAHLNGARGVLEAWDEDTGRWEVEVFSSRERILVLEKNVELYVSEDDRRQQAAKHRLPTARPEHLQRLRSFQIPSLFDAPQVHRLLWGGVPAAVLSSQRAEDAGASSASLGGVPCYVFGSRRTQSDGVADNGGTPHVLVFPGQRRLRSSSARTGLEGAVAVAMAYAQGFGALAVVPRDVPCTSSVLTRARALAASLPEELGTSGPLIVHGIFTGSISAVQVAAEKSQDDADDPSCRLLVLEDGILSVDMIPGASGVVGGAPNDPFGQAWKLRMTRCPIALIAGDAEVLPFQRGQPVDLVARACPVTPVALLRSHAAVVDEVPGSRATPSLLPELQSAVARALHGAAP